MEREVLLRSRELAVAIGELREANAKLAELDVAKTVFFNNISHEFRTPLTLMIGPLEDALGGSGLDTTARQSLDLVHRNSLRLLKLVNALLDFSRLEAGRMDATYVSTDLAAYTADVASAYRAAIEEAGLKLIVSARSTLSKSTYEVLSFIASNPAQDSQNKNRRLEKLLAIERFYAEQKDVRGFGGGEVVGGDSDAELAGKSFGAGFMRDRGNDPVSGEEAALEEGLQKNAAHLAGAEYGDAQRCGVGGLR